MKKIFTILSCLTIATTAALAQSWTTASNENADGIWTVGETATGVYTTESMIVSEGFITPELVIMSGVEAPVANTPEVKAYPNPVNNILHIQWNEPTEYKWSISAVDGRTLLQGTSNGNQNTIDCSSLDKGIYVLNITSIHSQQSTKIIKE